MGCVVLVRVRAVLCVLVLLLVSGCSEPPGLRSLVLPLGPHLQVVQEAIDVGPVAPGETGSGELVLRSIGTEAVDVTGLVLSGLGWAGTPLAPIRLEPGSEHVVRLQFSGGTGGDGLLRIASTDPSRPLSFVGLRAIPLAPALVLEPSQLAFTALPDGCGSTGRVTLRNDGSSALHVDEITVDGGFAIDASGPVIIPAGDELHVEVTWSGPDVAQGALRVISDAPEGIAQASLVASPTAVIEDRYAGRPPGGVDLLVLLDTSGSMNTDRAAIAAAQDVLTSGLAAAEARIAVATPGGIAFLDADLRLADAILNNEISVDAEALFTVGAEALAGTDLGSDRPLHVLALSDEAEQSPGTVAEWAATWRSLQPDGFVFSAVSGGAEGCDGVLPTPRYAALAESTGGADLSICGDAADWLQVAADDTVALSQSVWPLSQQPEPTSIEAFVDGLPVSATWLPEPNAVQLAIAPTEGAEVLLRYQLAASCLDS